MRSDNQPKIALIAGGSSGLGKAIALSLAAEGAHIYILGRRQTLLNDTLREILPARKSPDSQRIHAISVDLADSTDVSRVVKSLPQLPDILYCCAGDAFAGIGFFADIDPSYIDDCMKDNYLSAAYITQHMLKTWITEDKNIASAQAKRRKHRQIVFIASTAAFVGLPGYGIYAASKCATRALADTLRMECLRLSSPTSLYTVHIAFISDFITPTFLSRQRGKPRICKQIEGATLTEANLSKKSSSSATVARKIIRAVEKNDYIICDGSIESALLFANMVGPSPRRGLGIWDSFMSVIMGILLFPILRRVWDRMCVKDGERVRRLAKGADIARTV